MMSYVKRLRNSFLLLMAALIWGFAFAFQRLGGDAMGPFTMNCLRSFLGCAVLLPVVRLVYGNMKPDQRTLIAGVLSGICLSFACNLQQIGIMLSSPGKAGFITASYMIIVALIGLFTKKKPGKIVLIAVLLGVIGLYLICVPVGEDMSINKGDLCCMGAAVFFALQIFVLDWAGDGVQSIKLSAIQFLICGILSGVLMLAFEDPSLSDIRKGLIPLLYVGILSTGVAYTLQIVGMKGQNPAVASLIMSLESVFSVLGERVIFNTMMSGRALLGCCIMFAATLLSQADTFKTSKTDRKTDTETAV